MGVLKIRDENGNFIPVPVIKGKDGSSGVHVGLEEPTDMSVNMWVKPDGEPDVLVQCDEQDLTEDQKTQARENIGAAGMDEVSILSDALPKNLETVVSTNNASPAYVISATDYQFDTLIYVFKFKPSSVRVWPMNGDPASSLSSATLRERAYRDRATWNVMCNGGLEGFYRFRGTAYEQWNTSLAPDVPYYCALALNGMAFIPNLALTVTRDDIQNNSELLSLYSYWSGGGGLAPLPGLNSAAILPVFGPLVVNGEIFNPDEVINSGYDNIGIQHFIEVQGKHPRQILGMDSDYNYYIISAMGRTFYNAGLTYAESAQVAKSYGLINAVMLDGGGSVATYIDAEPQFPSCDDTRQFGRTNKSCVQFKV